MHKAQRSLLSSEWAIKSWFLSWISQFFYWLWNRSTLLTQKTVRISISFYQRHLSSYFVLFMQDDDRCLDICGVSSISIQACSTAEEPLCKEVFTESNYMTPVLPEQQKNLNLEHYRALVHINCSEFTRLFVCLTHMPLCTLHYPHLQAL